MERTRSLGTVAVFVAMLAILGGCGPKTHSVHISSEPAGAVVFLNGAVFEFPQALHFELTAASQQQ